MASVCSFRHVKAPEFVLICPSPVKLWDVVNDQGAVDLVRAVSDPRQAAEELLDYAYKNYSTDNVTVLVVRFRDPPESVRAD